MTVPLEGEGRFCFQGEALIHDFSESADAGWNASLYYSFNQKPGDQSTLRVQQYPLFAPPPPEGATQNLLDLRSDPLRPLDPDRTYLGFTGQSFVMKPNKDGKFPPYVLESTSIKLVSYFRTVYGATVSLFPVADSAKLVIERIPGEDKYATRAGG